MSTSKPTSTTTETSTAIATTRVGPGNICCVYYLFPVLIKNCYKLIFWLLEYYAARGIQSAYSSILGVDKICQNVGNNHQNYLVPHADCIKFYMCQYLGGNRWKAHVIDCAENTVWDDQHKACNWFEKFKKRNENCQDYGTQSYSLWQSIGYFLYYLEILYRYWIE